MLILSAISDSSKSLESPTFVSPICQLAYSSCTKFYAESARPRLLEVGRKDCHLTSVAVQNKKAAISTMATV